ncbi:MAG: FAD-dependent thymidylate synthase [Elusimicrobiota bacterium]|jgi:thymidylate synthase (FAD)|nr:FAD-dependent thymidylate synthase [Elusimicrobiota bacterium]
MKVELIKYTKDPQRTCALASRMCYSDIGLEALELEMSEEKCEKLLKYVIASGHHSILEHANFTFSISHVSRALLAQMTRHRLASFSVQSQRYVKASVPEFVVPPSIASDEKILKKYNSFILNAYQVYAELLEAGIIKEDARFVLPNAVATNIIVSMNARELRHFFAIRCCRRSQWEIRDLAWHMLKLAKEIAPILFEDAGPGCIRGHCPEVKPCGNPYKKEFLQTL